MKIKNILLVSFLCVSGMLSAQKFSTRTGTVAFEASVPSFEEVAATNSSVSAVLDADKKQIAVLALMKGFRFKVALMEEHFNENYVESDKYPKASFKGTIEGFDKNKLSENKTTVTIKGDLTLHGKTKPVTTKATVYKKDGTIYVDGSFLVKPADFDIEIPSVVSKKIAEDIKITFSLPLK